MFESMPKLSATLLTVLVVCGLTAGIALLAAVSAELDRPKAKK